MVAREKERERERSTTQTRILTALVQGDEQQDRWDREAHEAEEAW
jgi:hypothetical protein